jgi:hypothetical protein
VLLVVRSTLSALPGCALIWVKARVASLLPGAPRLIVEIDQTSHARTSALF